MTVSRRFCRDSLIGQILANGAPVMLALFCLTSILVLAVQQRTRIFQLSEVGYGDSYLLYDIQHFQNTGTIYRDLSKPPYLPAQYSPLVYALYSLPARMIQTKNPFIGPRLIVLLGFLLCIAAVSSIAKALIPHRWVWFWAILLAASIGCMREWIPQVRGDFPGIFCNFLAIRFLVGRSKWAAGVAGLCAGMATQFKFTFVAALAAGALWLIWRAEWRRLACFAAGGTAFSAGLYFLFWLCEPRMIPQILALSPGIWDLPGALNLIYRSLSEPALLLALLAIPIPLGIRIGGSKWGLLVLFAMLSLLVGSVTAMHVGANINYFYEGLFALIPAAVLGVFRITIWTRRHPGIAVFVVVLCLVQLVKPIAAQLRSAIRSEPAAVRSNDEQLSKLQSALAGHPMLSFIPRLALFDPDPPLMEPFLLTYSERMRKFNPAPILEGLQEHRFDLVITPAEFRSYRGIAHVAPDLHHAIAADYTPWCVVSDSLVHFPKGRAEDRLLSHELNQAGCARVFCDRAATCPAW